MQSPQEQQTYTWTDQKPFLVGLKIIFLVFDAELSIISPPRMSVTGVCPAN